MPPSLVLKAHNLSGDNRNARLSNQEKRATVALLCRHSVERRGWSRRKATLIWHGGVDRVSVDPSVAHVTV